MFGTHRVNRSYVNQLAGVKAQAAQSLGSVPILFGEFGIPLDLNKKKAYRTGDFSDQIRAMDRSMQAMDGNLLNFTLWNYTSDNTNERGDRWNDEDLSLFSRDQQKDPHDINSGGRALAAAVRPYPVCTAGIPLSIKFDYRNGHFEFSFKSDPAIAAPTILFIPKLQYPNGIKTIVTGGEVHYMKENQILEYRPSNSGIHTIIIEHR